MFRPGPEFAECEGRDDIAKSISSVVVRLLQLHRAEIEAVKRGDVQELKRLGEELENYTALETSLLQRFQAHLQSHGCQQPIVLS